jgi:hypothetical protein
MTDSMFPRPPASTEGVSAISFYAAMFFHAHIVKHGLDGPADEIKKHAKRAVAVANTFREALADDGIKN